MSGNISIHKKYQIFFDKHFDIICILTMNYQTTSTTIGAWKCNLQPLNYDTPSVRPADRPTNQQTDEH